MEYTGDGTVVDDTLVNTRTVLIAAAIHLCMLVFIGIGALLTKKDRELPPPTELTIVPPWAVQTDDPDPDPLPPPEEVPQVQPKPKPTPVIKTPEVQQDAVIKEKPKEKVKEPPKEKPKPKEPEDLRKKAKLVNEPVPQAKPVDLRDRAKLIPANIPRTGKATANDKPMSPEEFQRLMNQGYQIGARNQLAGSEEQRCVSLIKRAIQTEWDKETFNWFPGLTPLQVQLRLGPGGRVLGFRIVGLSGSAEVDRTARAALDRVRTINGLSRQFIEQFPEIQVEMKPVGGG